MLLLAGVISITEVTRIGHSVQGLVNENYKSISSTNKMLESIENENTGIILMLVGQQDRGKEIIIKSDSIFREAFAQMIVLPYYAQKKDLIDSTNLAYRAFIRDWFTSPKLERKNSDQTFIELISTLSSIKTLIRRMQTVQQNETYKQAAYIENNAKRAAMPGIVAVISAVLFALIFNYFINYYFISPLLKITRGVENTLKYNTLFTVEVETNDEMAKLKDAIQNYIASHQYLNKR
jgi:methyl-accepting chemotaxis protein